MSLISYTHDQNSIIVRIKILNSSVATGAGLTGLTSASSGLIVSTIADNEASATAYTVAGSNVETIATLGTYAAPTAGKCRFKEVDATNHPGVYEIQFEDARFGVSSAKYLLVSVLGATNAAETDALIPLTQVDPYDATTGGMTGVSTHSAADVWTSGTRTLTSAANITSDASAIDVTSGIIDRVTLVDTTTANTDMRVTDSAFLAANAPTNFGDLAITATSGRVDVGEWLGTAVTISSTSAKPEVDMYSVSDDATAADNIEATYDGSGYADDNAPATQAQVGALSTGSAAISVEAESYTLTDGVQSANAYTDTDTVDGVEHTHTGATSMELYYQFDVGGNGTSVEAEITGRLTGNNDDLGVYAYDWDGASWDQIGTLEGQNGSTNITESYNLLVRHTGTGANLGKVRIRFYAASGLTSATLYIDQIFTSYAVVTQSVGYSNGSVWIDTVDGASGTTSFFNGVADNPSDNLADAITIAGNVGLSTFELSPDSSIVFIGSHSGEHWKGTGWTCTLGGQDLSKTHITHAKVYGACTSPTGEVHIHDSHLEDVGFGGDTHLSNCNIEGTLTLSAIGNYILENCKSETAGGTAPIIDFGAAIGTTTMTIRDYNGDLTISNLESGDILCIDGILGTITLNGADAEVSVNGIAVSVVNNLTGSPTFNDYTIKSSNLDAIETDTQDIQSSIGTVTDLGSGSTIADNFTDIAGATFATGTDSLEAIRNRGDAAWITATGFSTLVASDIVSDGVALDTTSGVLDVVNLVNTTTTNTDMRGTDGANTVVPMAAALSQTEHDATQSSIAGLNDIAATDIVSAGAITTLSGAVVNVDLVDLVTTTTTNTDMRGTDSSLLAASAPTNWSSMVISAGGAADSLVQGYLNNTIAESTANNIATNFEVFFDNADAITTQTVDDVGGGSSLTVADIADGVWDEATAGHTTAGTYGKAVSDILVDTGTTIPAQISGLNNFDPTSDTVANVTLVATTTTNTDMRGTDSALLAASAPTNWSSLVISGAGAVDSLVQGFLNNTIAETTADNIAANFETFYDNADAITTQTVDDVGGGGGGGGDATEAKQDTIITHLTDVKGTGFAKDTHSLTDITEDVTGIAGSAMRGTDSALLAASAPTNFGALGISVGGAIDDVTLVATTTTNTDMRGTDNALLAASAPTNFGDLAITATTGLVSVGTNNDKTGYSISGTITTLDGLDTALDSAHGAGSWISATGFSTHTAADVWTSGTRGLTTAANITSDASAIDVTSGTVDNVTLVATTTTNTDMRGTDSAFLAANAPTNFADLAITASTGKVTVGTNDDKTGYSISGTTTTFDDFDTLLDAAHGAGSWATSTLAGGDVWDALKSAHTDAGSFGLSMADIEDDTNELQGDWADGGRLDLMIDTIVAAVEAQGEPGQGNPAVSADIGTKVSYLYKWARNEVRQTSTTRSHYNDAGDTVDQKATVSDDGTTYTRQEMETGP